MQVGHWLGRVVEYRPRTDGRQTTSAYHPWSLYSTRLAMAKPTGIILSPKLVPFGSRAKRSLFITPRPGRERPQTPAVR